MNALIEHISAVILVKNGEKHLGKTLSSLSRFKEVIVLNNESTDGTIAIAEAYSNTKIFHTPFIGFGALKNLAASHAQNDWIFIIDSDEVATAALTDEIAKIDLQRTTCIYSIERNNFYRQKLIEGCGWNKDWQKRIFNKKHTHFADKQVHEHLVEHADTKTLRLKSKLLHYPFDSIKQLLDKLNQYSELYAKEHFKKKDSSVFKSFYKGLYTFFRDFVLERGFLYGYEGFLISVCNGNGAFYKYMKLYEENRFFKTSLLITTYNRPDALELVLLSILKQTTLPDEVIIADDGSADETKTLIERFQQNFPVPLIHCWHEDKGFQLSAIRNKAIAKAAHPYILMVDGDMVLHKNFVRIQKKLAWRDHYVQGKRVLLSEECTKKVLQQKKWRFHFFSSGIKNRFNSISSACLSSLLSKQKNTVDSVKGCSMSFWKKNVIDVNGFNEDFNGWGREDSEFVARWLNAGLKRKNMIFGSVAYHLYHPEATRASLPQNDQILERAMKEKLARCENGINKYL